MIIGISGKKQSGKDTVGKIIQYLTAYTNIVTSQHSGSMSFDFFNSIYKDLEQDWEIKKFADKVKDIVCLLINCTREQLEDEEFKNTELGEDWVKYVLTYTDKYRDTPYEKTFLSEEECHEHIDSQNCVYSADIEKIILTPRLLLQLVGTECGRNIIHPNIWVNATMSGYTPYSARGSSYEFEESNWVITDVRFPNEKKAIEDKGGFVIRMEGTANIYTEDIHPSETALDNAEFTYVIQHNKDLNIVVEKVKEILILEKIL